jgi:CBS domain-containing protein
MLVQQILSAKGDRVVTLQPAATVTEALQLLDAEKIGAVVVTGPAGDVVGIVSERDIVRGLSDSGAALLNAPVSQVMTRSVTTCTPDTDLDEVMRQMTAGRFRHVPILREGRLAGIVSIGDVVKNRLEQLEAETEQLQSYIKS